MRAFGLIVLLVGFVLGVYALFIFDPTVSTGSGRVNNIGLLQQKQNLLIAACAAAVIGVILFVVGHRQGTGTVEERAFKYAIETKDLTRMRELLSSKAIDARGHLPDGQGWIQFATTRMGIEPCEVLLEWGADPRQKDLNGMVASAMARSRHWKEAVDLFDRHPSKTEPRGASHDPVGTHEFTTQLAQLADLHQRGVLTSGEFTAAKARLLGSSSA